MRPTTDGGRPAPSPADRSAPLRIMVVFGTRPEAIKVAPVLLGMARHAGFEPVVVVTSQHTSMLDPVLKVFGIRPDHDLHVGRHRQSLTSITTGVLSGLEPLIDHHRPDAVLVQGDTTTTLAGALAAFYQKVPVVHLEAGLRTRNRDSPFPEELNRRLTTEMTSLHLAPTPRSKADLLADGVDPDAIVCTGNTVIDALYQAVGTGVPGAPAPTGPCRPGLDGGIRPPIVERLLADGRRVVLVTVHRRELGADGLARIGRALAALADDPALLIVLPLHPDPRLRDALGPFVTDRDNMMVLGPQPYLVFCRLLEVAELVLTDSGGIQEEAPSLGKPVLVLRESTERPEAVTAGTVRLVGTGTASIVGEARRLLADPDAYRVMARAINPYGDGRATGRVLDAMSWAFDGTRRPEEFVPVGAGEGACSR